MSEKGPYQPPTERQPVHNHGPDEGRGLDCGEAIEDGHLRGWCLRRHPRECRCDRCWHDARDGYGP